VIDIIGDLNEIHVTTIPIDVKECPRFLILIRHKMGHQGHSDHLYWWLWYSVL